MSVELWTRKVRGQSDDIGWLSCTVEGLAPAWFLHGMTSPVKCTEDLQDETYEAILWGENNFLISHKVSSGVEVLDVPLTEQEMAEVLSSAAAQAVKLAVHEGNYQLVGEVWLKRHPECRQCSSDDMAVIAASLKERASSMSEGEYEV